MCSICIQFIITFLLQLGCPPRIPGNETLLYEVYIVNVIDDAAADAYDELDEKMQTNTTFEQRLEAARGFHRKVRSFRIVSFLLQFVQA